MRNLEALRNLNKEAGVFKNILGFQLPESPTVATQPDLPGFSPSDIIVVKSVFDEKIFPENRQQTTNITKRLLATDGDFSVNEPLVAERPSVFKKPGTQEVTIFTAPVKRLTNILLGQNS